MQKIVFCFALFLSHYVIAASYDYSVEMKESDGTVTHMGDIRINVVDSNQNDVRENSNPDLLNQIQDYIKGRFRRYNVNIKVAGDAVTLTGTVSSDHDKQSIENEIRRFPGVNKVDNQLQVK